ncbi:unnamed protein product [Enterobius vermicularis]|uniref:Uncharacterized protein n=1 Tax=Enterobius vermicularis TaxID=51028 RepID=A0A0N4VPN3_ENTVE|nr:unnamed protein product [Enterobius vermicularis]
MVLVAKTVMVMVLVVMMSMMAIMVIVIVIVTEMVMMIVLLMLMMAATIQMCRLNSIGKVEPIGKQEREGFPVFFGSFCLF